MSPAAKRGPPTGGLSTLNWRFTGQATDRLIEIRPGLEVVIRGLVQFMGPGFALYVLWRLLLDAIRSRHFNETLYFIGVCLRGWLGSLFRSWARCPNAV